MKMKTIIISICFFFGFLYSGGIEGFVFRKAKITELVKINRYSLRNNYTTQEKLSSSNDLAIVYLMSSKEFKEKQTGIPKIVQKGLAFDPWLLPIYVGTKVDFPNMDLVFHNVFSYSKTKKFDLGRYGKGESKQVLFDKPGLVKVFCEIHKTMRAYILVLETPYFTTTNENKYFIIKDVPDGEYTLHVWQENTEEYNTQVEIKNNNLISIDVK
jgi:plastocyanin